MKTLNEQINSVLKSQSSINAKRVQLEELGLTRSDINLLIQSSMAEQRAAERARRAAQEVLNHFTFGVEIECYNAPTSLLLERARENAVAMQYEGYNHQDRINHYKLVTDASIQGAHPIECVTPILRGTNGFNSLKACCKALNETGAKVNTSTGLHVHVGGISDGAHYVNVFKNYLFLERLIDTFMAESRRGDNNRWARTLQGRIFNSCQNADDVDRVMGYDRYFKVNPCSWARHRTIEFRQHQGTTNFEKIKMWARFCIKLVAWSANNVLTERPQSINEIPFLDAAEKRFFTQRANELVREVA